MVNSVRSMYEETRSDQASTKHQLVSPREACSRAGFWMITFQGGVLGQFPLLRSARLMIIVHNPENGLCPLALVVEKYGLRRIFIRSNNRAFAVFRGLLCLLNRSMGEHAHA